MAEGVPGSLQRRGEALTRKGLHDPSAAEPVAREAVHV